MTAWTIRRARSASFVFEARRSTIRLPYVFPRRIMAPVLSILSTIFVAVPAFMRVEPLTTSGPTTTANADIAVGGELRIAIATDADGKGTDALGVFQAADDIGRAAAGGDADQHVALGEVRFFEIFDAEIGAIFGPFDGGREGRVAAGDNADDLRRIGVERGGAFDGIEHAETTRGAGAGIDQSAAVFKAIGDDIDGLSDGIGLFGNGGGNFSVFGVDELHDLLCG